MRHLALVQTIHFCFYLFFFFLDAPSHLYKRSCPSVRPSGVIFEGKKYAYQAHLVPCIRPCFFLSSVRTRAFVIVDHFLCALINRYSILGTKVLTTIDRRASPLLGDQAHRFLCKQRSGRSSNAVDTVNDWPFKFLIISAPSCFFTSFSFLRKPFFFSPRLDVLYF